MPLTDAQLTQLATDVVAAYQAEQAAAGNLAQAKRALAQALGPGGQMVIKGRLIEANAEATDLRVTALRVVP